MIQTTTINISWLILKLFVITQRSQTMLYSWAACKRYPPPPPPANALKRVCFHNIVCRRGVGLSLETPEVLQKWISCYSFIFNMLYAVEELSPGFVFVASTVPHDCHLKTLSPLTTRFHTSGASLYRIIIKYYRNCANIEKWQDKQTNQQTLFHTTSEDSSPSPEERGEKRRAAATTRPSRDSFSHDRLGPNKSYQPIKIVHREIRNTFQQHSNMAADTKHSALQVASLCCENQSTYPQKQGNIWQDFHLELKISANFLIFGLHRGLFLASRASWDSRLQQNKRHSRTKKHRNS